MKRFKLFLRYLFTLVGVMAVLIVPMVFFEGHLGFIYGIGLPLTLIIIILWYESGENVECHD